MKNLFYRQRIFRFLVISFLTLFLLLNVASAHSGRTDSNGGHTVSATGEYHYHHGYPAHDHEDLDGDGDLDCPYAFVDNTGLSSKSSPGSSNAENNKTSAVVEDEKDGGWWIYLVLLVGLWIACCVIAVRADDVKRKADAEIRQIQSDADAQIKSYADYLRGMEENHAIELRKQAEANAELVERAVQQEQSAVKRGLHDLVWALYKKHGVRWLYDLAGAPEGCVVVPETNLPSETPVPAHGWGPRFTFFVNENARTAQKKYHRQSCKYATCAVGVNAYTIWKNRDKYTPCGKCKPELPDMQWVDRYLPHKAFLEKYVPSKIIPPNPPNPPERRTPMTADEQADLVQQLEQWLQSLPDKQNRKEQQSTKSGPTPAPGK